VLCLAIIPMPVVGQTGVGNFRNPAIWRAVEDEMFAEINLLRSQPSQYADEVLAPLKQRVIREPRAESEKLIGYRVFLKDADPIDYIEIREGKTPEAALAVVEEAIAALKAAPKLHTLQRDDVLDKAARFMARDYLDGGPRRKPHVDSLRRNVGQRLAAFGTSRDALNDWRMFTDSLNEESETLLHVYEREGTFFRVLYPRRGRYLYRYYSVPKKFAKFVSDHGQAVTLPHVGKPGHACLVKVDPKARTVRCEKAVAPFPVPLPIYGENIAWGPWSRRWAARGLVCWWLLDPGVRNRGHRKCLLDRDFRHCGVGCAWSAKLGWAATFDASSEPFVEYDD
jgi:uncharacterized protein YkwD